MVSQRIPTFSPFFSYFFSFVQQFTKIYRFILQLLPLNNLRVSSNPCIGGSNTPGRA